VKKKSIFNFPYSILLVAAMIAHIGYNKCGKNGDDYNINDNIKPPPLAASTKTWKIESPDGKIKQTWSDYIAVPACNKTDYDGGDRENPRSDCRSYTFDGATFYYYSWQYVKQNQHTLCPDPWRMPTKEDINDIVAAKDAGGGYIKNDPIYQFETERRDMGRMQGGLAVPTTSGQQVHAEYGDIHALWSASAKNRFQRPRPREPVVYDGGTTTGWRIRCVR
jgi:hypothetical protein